MHVRTPNVENAFRYFVSGIHRETIRTVQTPSRNGPVMRVAHTPVTITYWNPTQCVLFNEGRDANPFFHLFEAAWMLAGRNDLRSLQTYVKTFDNYSDDGIHLNGAYGYRWRYRFGVDQLSVIIDHLRNVKTSRRAVLQMWDVGRDLLNIDTSKDVCCNTHAYFGVVDAGNGYQLDMTVCNRSNDLVWGCFGANAVHFAILQEYMANAIGVNVGVYNQFTNDLHVYLSNWNPDAWLKQYEPIGPITPVDRLDWYLNDVGQALPYRDYFHVPVIDIRYGAMASSREEFDTELDRFVRDHSNGQFELFSYRQPWIRHLLEPMCIAHYLHKRGDSKDALEVMKRVKAEDWREAGKAWLERRIERKKARESVSTG